MEKERERQSIERERKREVEWRSRSISERKRARARARLNAGTTGTRMCSDHINASIAMHCAFTNRNASRLNDVHAIIVLGLPLNYHLLALFETHKFASAAWKTIVNAFRINGDTNAHRHSHAHALIHACTLKVEAETD